ncbi:hypothetical protein MMC14_005277 [Varicellaria rhodocarpa]|nr:hypothetical protein [Varicellaria rhodocarpa]
MDLPHFNTDRNGYMVLPNELNSPSHQLTDPSYIPYLGQSESNHLNLEHYPFYPYERMDGRQGYDYDAYQKHGQYESTSSNPLDPSQDLSQDHCHPLQLWDNTNPRSSEYSSLPQLKNCPPSIPSDQSWSHVTTPSENVPAPKHQTPLVLPPSAPPTTEAQEPQSLSRRRYTPERWTEVRPTIQGLYIDHGFSLCKTRKIMEEQHEFVASYVPEDDKGLTDQADD